MKDIVEKATGRPPQNLDSFIEEDKLVYRSRNFYIHHLQTPGDSGYLIVLKLNQTLFEIYITCTIRRRYIRVSILYHNVFLLKACMN